MQIHPWKQVLSSIAEQPVLAEWHLLSGVTFLMYTPSIERLGSEEVEGTTVHYEELIELVVRAQQQLGSLNATNDIAATRYKTESSPGVEVLSTASEIRIQLKAVPNDPGA